jgi:gliding motility-associated-like protein
MNTFFTHCSTRLFAGFQKQATTTTSFTKQLLLQLAVILFTVSSYAQISNMEFTNAAATYTPITGGAALIPGNSAAVASAVTNIGFPFKFQGVDYTQFSVNTAGLLKLGSVAVTNENANNPVSVTNVPKLYAFWDPFYTGSVASGGGVTYLLTGTAPNRVLTVQWNVGLAQNVAWTTTFQIKLYETSNKIEYRYGTGTATTYSGSTGMGGLDAADEYLSVLTANTTISGNIPFAANNVIPGAGAGMVYTFTPSTPITSSPACLTDAPNLWVKADAGINQTRTLLNVPAASRTATSIWSAVWPASASTLTGANAWMPSAAEGGNGVPTGVMGSITLDLGSVQAIDGIATLGASATNNFVSDFTVKVSNDNLTWTNLGMFPGNEVYTELHYADFDAPVTCRYVRVIPGGFLTYRAIRLDVYTKSAAAAPANNTKVTVWDDQSANGWDASQPTTVANEPVYLTNQFNFNPALNFAAASKLDIPDYNISVRYAVNAPAVGAVPSVVTGIYSPIIQHAAITGPQVIAENISYRYPITATQESIVKSYLATKYGITLAQDYVATDGTTKTFDLTANAGYTNNIFGIGRTDCQDLHQRQSKSSNLDGLITIGNNNTIDFTNGNTSTSGNNIATDSSYLLLGDNGGPLELNTSTIVDTNKLIVNRIWKLQETGTIGSVKISVPAFGNTAATATLPMLTGTLMPATPTVYVVVDSDINLGNGGTTYYPMTAVGSGATLTYEANVDLTSAAPYVRFAVGIADTDADTTFDVLDIDADNDGILNAVESPSCFYTALEMSDFDVVSSELTQYSTWVITNAIEPSTAGSAFTTGQNWVGKEIFNFTAKGYTAIASLTFDLVSWPLSSAATSTFKLQGSFNGTSWVDLSAPVASTATTGSFTVNNTLAPTTKFKYFRVLGVAGTSGYGGVTYVSLNVPSTYNPSANPKASCTSDTDADGIPNHLDLDSDGDACPDAYEAGITGTLTTGTVVNLTTGSTTATTATPAVANAIAAGPYNANGLVDALQTTGNGIYTGIYSYTYAINAKYNLCADFDSDGVKDIYDLDDDNDGVLDHIESPTCFVSKAEMTKPISITSQLAPHVATELIGNAIDNDPATKSAFLNALDWVDQEVFNFVAAGSTAITGVTLDLASWALSTNATSTFKLQGSQDNYYWKDLSTPVASIATTGSFTVSNTLLPNTPFKYFRIIGVAGTCSYGGVTDLRINVPTTFNSSGYPKEICTNDTNTDGKLNHQDVNSDGDSCFDGIEAGALPVTNTTGIAPGTAFGLNGFADALETVAENGIFNKAYFYDYAVNATISNCTDTDGEGLLNVVDIDDDNDGVLDAEEAPDCYMSTYQSWNNTNKTEFVKITSDLNTLAATSNFAALTDNTNTAAVQFVTVTAQTQYNKELFRATFAQPIQLDAFYIKKTNATQIFGAGLMIQGSNDPNNGAWTNLLPAAIASPIDATNVTVNGSISLTNSNKFTIAANAGKYKYYRIFGTTDVDILSGVPTEFYFDVNRAAYIPSSFPKAICTTDTDADGIINTLDLDSDGDGCADAVEATANRGATSTSVYPTGTDANANGLLDNYEGTPAGTTNYFSTYTNYAIVNTIDSCLDSDLDNIPDSIDIDDDNDGVLDADEQINCAYPQKDLTALTFNGNANGVFTATDLTLAATVGSSWGTKYSDQKLKLPIHLEYTSNTTVNHGMIGLFPVAKTKTPADWPDGGYKIYHNGANIYGHSPPISGWSFNQPYTANDLLEMDINTAGVVTIRQNGWVIRSFKGTKSDYNLAFSSYTNAKVFQNIKLTSYSPIDMVCTDVDTDGDGIVNRLDLDSDADGCNDAVEAGAATVSVAIPFVGAVGTNGLLDSKEATADSGDINYTSTYGSYGMSSGFNACLDTDVDGIGDLMDIDDDNDGLTDDIEQGCSSPLFANKTSTYTAATKTGLMTGTVLKETGNIDYELKMTGPALAFNPASYDSGNGLHFLVGDGGKLNINLNFKLTSTAFEASPVPTAPKVKYVDFGPNVPINTVPSQPINEIQNITLDWPGAYGVVSDPFNQLSSHNTGDIIESGDLIEQNVNISAADVAAKKTWTVRMFMHTNADVYLINANIYGDPTVAIQSYGFNLAACSSFDTDSDGVINELDLDSDDDGCSDAFEGGATTNTTANYAFANGTVGTNGLTSTLEVADTISTAVNYTTSYNIALTDVLNKCLDTDGDTVNNVIDIDDDNDGILDSEEMSCGAADFTMANLTTTPAPTGNLQNLSGKLFRGSAYADYEINMVGVKTVYTSPGTAETSFDNSKGGLHYFLTDDDNIYSQTFRILPSAPSSLNKVQFGVNTPFNQFSPTSNSNDAQSITLTWAPDVKGIIYDPNDQLSTHATGDVITPGTVITTRANYTTAASTWRIDFMTNGSSEQFFLQTTHKATSSTNFSVESFGINADLCFSDDTDGDRTPDYLDTDSDGDGCGDAFEAGASSTPGGATQTVAGPFGANGFANALESNDTQLAIINYTTTAYMAYSPVSACADTDSDTIPDRDDIDDDNDGILDADEYTCEVSKFVKSYLLPSGLGMSYGGSLSTSIASGAITTTYSNLTGLVSVTDLQNAASFVSNDANGAYTMKSTIAPTNGILSQISFGPNLAGNTANAAISNAQQSITVSWNLPIGATVYDPDDQLSSHATGDAINPGGVLVTRAAYTVGEQTWKIVLPLPYINRELVFTASFSSASNFGQESFGIAANICKKVTDLDADGKMNAVDTDADGDGCFDLVESKSHKNTTLTQEIIGGTFGPNGLSSLVETNDTDQAGINYTLVNDFLNKKIKGCTDTDGDNVPDIDDIDDDNDGILDQTECPTTPGITAFTFTPINGNQFYINDKATGQHIAKATVARIKNMVADGLSFNVNDYSINGHWADLASTNNVDRQMYLKFEPVAPYTAMKMSVLASEGGNGGWWFHPRKWKVNGGIAGDGVIKSIPQRYYLKEPYSVGDVITPNMWMSTAFKGALGPDANKVFIQVQYTAVTTVAKPLVITYTWNTVTGTVANENFGFQLMDMSPSTGDGTCDYDHDGINDDLDSDSDNDGCPDAREAVHGKALATNKNYIKGPYGANGFSTLMETNDTFAATYSTTSWLPKVTTTPKSDYVNELVTTRCIIPFIVPAGPIAFCAPGSTVMNINLNGGTAPVSYQWEKDGVAITGATSSSYTATETGDYTCTLTYADTSTITTDPQDITANPAPTAPVVTASPGTTVCLGTPATLTSSYTTGNQWYYNTNSIVGATAVTYAASASGDYKVEYTDPLTGCKNFSTTTVVVIAAVPATPTVVLTQPTCSTSTGTITVTPSGNAGDTYTVTGTTPVVAAATNDTGIFSGLASGTYTVVTTNANGCSSAAETVVINAALVVPANPSITAGSGLAICAGGATTLTSSASTGNQWYKDGSIIAGATTATFTAAFAGSYTVQVTSTDGCSATSPATVVTVSPSPTASLTQSTVLSSSNCGTASPILLTASTDATGATYAWYKDGVVIGGATASTYTALQTGSYTVVVTSAAGCPTTSAPSSVTTGPSASAGSPASICAGQNFTFTATVTGFTSPTFAWEYSANGTSGWATPSTGVTNAVNYLATTAGFYRVIVSDSTPQTVTSCPTELKVNALPTATIGASPAGALCAGQTTTLTATAAATSPATIASYQWLDGSTNIAGATTATYATGIASSYAVLVTDSNGCQATAAPATVAVNALPAAPTSTVTQPTCATATGTITVTAPVGSGYTYTVTGTNPVVAAVTNGTGIFSGLATGTYSVKATVNGCEGPSTTEVINAQPTTLSITGTISGNATPLLGGSETYTITAVPGAISYIWTLPNGSWIGTSTSNTIIATPAAMTGNTGTITVKAVSADGCESAPVSLTVAVKPAAPTVASAAYCQNATAIALTATADAGGTLNWYTTSTGSVVPSSLTPTTTTAGTTSYFVSQTVNGVESDRAEIIVTVNAIPAQPGTISGATSVVSGSIEDYSIAAVSGADSYVWTLPSGTTGNSTAAAIRATYASTAGSITVKAVSAAGCESPLQTMAITIKPAAPTVAPVVVCQFTPTAPLSVTPVSGATLNWYTVATGGTASSTVPTPSRSVVGTTSYFVSQTLGGIESDRSEITVTINSVPAKPGAITGTTAVAIGATEVYAIAAVAGATSYTWTLPNGWTGTSTTETISATVGSLAGNIKVTANANGCPSPAATFALQPPLDSDGDGVSDDDEAIDGTDPYNPCDYNPAKQYIENTSAAWQSNDCDGDGLTNKEEKTGIDNPATPANPNGKITDPLNVDTDGDGVTDAQEAIDGTDPTNPCAFKLTSQTVATSAAWKAADCDGDGLTNEEEKTGVDNPSTPANPNGKITDPLNVDTDGDGVTDAQEALDGTDPTDRCSYKPASQTVATSAAWKAADCDADGLTNEEEKTGVDNPSTPANPNGKITDPLNVDTDGDGVTDAQEAIDGTDPTDPCAFKLSSQTVATSAAWKAADCDADGLTNQEEKTGIDNPATPANPSGKITDPLNVDTDGDGVTDAQEAIDGTDPTNPCAFKLTSQTVATSAAWKAADCDGDGLTNEEEKTGVDNPATPANPNGKITDPLNVDTDGDGVTDAQEAIDGTDPTNPCTFVLANQTVATSTAWNNADCDNDGETNGSEKTKGTDPKDPCSYTTAPLASSPAFAAWSALDCDGDGETNGFEYGKGTDPMDACSNTTPPVASSPAYATWAALDCDGDGETNGVEKTNGTDPNNSCSYTVTPTTAYALLDCDGDGTPNGVDPEPLDPCVHLAGAIPNTNSTVWAEADCDGDGETNGFENSHGTDPNDPCSFTTAPLASSPAFAAWSILDCDGDGTPNGTDTAPLNPCIHLPGATPVVTNPIWAAADCDGDGETNGFETTKGTDPNDACSFTTMPSASSAAFATWSALDCDGDGLTNKEELTGIDDPSTPANPNGKITDPMNVDTDGDGVTDAQEAIDGTDPTNPCAFKLTSQTVATSAAWKAADCDADGLTNQEEKTGIDDPSTPANPYAEITDPLNKDTDGDGVTDAQEAIDGTDPNNPCAFVLANQTVATSTAWNTADCDGDGESNSVEKTNGTDPLVTCSNSIPFPAPTITSSGSTVCSGTAITLTSSAASAYQWFKNGVAVNGATTQNFIVYDSGSYTVQVLNSLGCTSTLSNTEATVVSTPPTADISEGAVLAMNSTCNGTPINLTVSTNVTGATYQWTKDGVDITGATSTTYNATDAGLYRVKVSKGGCTTESAATKILPAADASSSVNPTLCAGDSVQLSVNTSGYSSAATYQWKKGGVVIATAAAPIYDATQSGVYTVEVTDGATTVSCPITVTVNALPVISIAIAPSATICAGDTSTMTAAVTGSSPFTYKWRTNGIEMNTATATSFGAIISGVYDVRVADANGCEAISAPSTIVVNALPTKVEAIATSQPTCSVGTGTITVSSPAATTGMTYSIDGTTYTNTTGIFDNILPGTYTVTAKNTNGCVGPSATVVINAQPITPAQPGVISGTLNVLPGTTYVYTISPVTDATSYTWTLPNGWGGTSTTTSISAIVATTGGTITVVANAGACISPASSLVVTIDMTSDTDGDGVLDSKEILDGTDPNDPCEYNISSITVPTGNAWNDADCDNDGLTNGEETIGIDNPLTPANPNGKITDPLNKDTDGDGVTDAQEAIDGTNPNDQCSFKLSSQTLTPSNAWKAADCDADGLTNQEEKTGIDDPSTPANPNGKITDPLNKDTDGDGVTDGQEAIDGTNPNDACSLKLTSQTLPTSNAWNNADCDGDGVTNGQEKIDGTNPNNPCDSKPIHVTLPFSSSFLAGDCDGDGLSNGNELGKIATSPQDIDKNGVPDYLEMTKYTPGSEELEVYNSVSPNGDGDNDTFIIRNIENYPNNTVSIYNRWGVKVFEVDGYGQDKVFRGISEGRVTVQKSEELPEGTYFYILRYANTSGEEKQRSGYLYIKR